MRDCGETLYFGEDGTFKIVQLTDLHVHDEDDRYRETLRLMGEILDRERPDLVVLTGDMISGKSCRDSEEMLRAALRPIEDRRIPWAAAFGNHDDEGTADRRSLLAVCRSHRYSLTQAGPEEVFGIGNYVVTVQGRGGKAGATLYFFDSNAYAPQGVGKYGWIRHDQVAWYRRTSETLADAAGGAPPAMAFFHIPLPEYDAVWDSGVCLGVKHESVCAPRLNSGLFLAMHEMGDVVGAFVGHDHVNDFEGEYYGIRLCYGRAGGFGTYGRDGMARGARVIRLHEGRRVFETWLRLDGGAYVERGAAADV